MKEWKILNKSRIISDKWQNEGLIDLLLENRNIKTKKDKEEFLNPDISKVNAKNVDINTTNLKKAVKRILKAVDNKEQIIIYGDYDVDGITGSAILWETIHAMNGNVMPYIPHRIDEGYGLSIRGIEKILEQKSKSKNVSLIITVDNGIVAHDAVDFAKTKNIDVIITDHHTVGKILPNAFTTIHTTKICGAAVAYLLAKEIRTTRHAPHPQDSHLELAMLGTVADLVPLTSTSRTIAKFGLGALGRSQRMGLKELFNEAKIEKKLFSIYDVGYIIAPRLNAAGRMESAMDSLRLLCTKDANRARTLAQKLELINRDRQHILKESTEHAIQEVNKKQKIKSKKILIVADQLYKQGVIGLIAGKLVEEFYRPSIAISIGDEYSKASVRSIPGFNIVDFLRSHPKFFTDIGGHPMAAGFTIKTKNLDSLIKTLEKAAEIAITDDLLKRKLKIDCELELACINTSLYDTIQTLAPFGMGNPEPVFITRDVWVKDFRLLGKDQSHLRLELSSKNQKPESISHEAIAFGMGKLTVKLKKKSTVDIAYSIDKNTWNGNTKLQLKIKDVKIYE